AIPILTSLLLCFKFASFKYPISFHFSFHSRNELFPFLVTDFLLLVFLLYLYNYYIIIKCTIIVVIVHFIYRYDRVHLFFYVVMYDYMLNYHLILHLLKVIK